MGIYRSGNMIYVTGNSFSPTQQAVWTYNTSTGSLTMNGLGVVGRCFGINGSLTAVGSDNVCYDATSPGALPRPRCTRWWPTSTATGSPLLGCKASTTPARLPDGERTAPGNSEGFLATPALPGDANLDGKVDINDLTVVLSHYNQTGMTWTEGEFTGDGTVDINDLTIVLAHYNENRRLRRRGPGRRAGALDGGPVIRRGGWPARLPVAKTEVKRWSTRSVSCRCKKAHNLGVALVVTDKSTAEAILPAP